MQADLLARPDGPRRFSSSQGFWVVRLTGDHVLLCMPTDIQAKDVEEFRRRLGFDDPLAAEAERVGRVYRVGFLGATSREEVGLYFKAFEDGLRELGYTEGRNYSLSTATPTSTRNGISISRRRW